MLLLAACQPAAEKPAFDFIAALPGAAYTSPAPRIDLGTTAGRGAQLTGWSNNEDWNGVSVVWAVGEHSELAFLRYAIGPLTMRYRCAPIGWPGAPAQSMRIAVNGVEVGHQNLAPGFHEYTVAIPPHALRAGSNRVTFFYAISSPPPDRTKDQRNLAVAWDWVAFEGSAPAAELRAKGETLHLPAGSRLDYIVRAEPGSRLQIDDLQAEGEGQRLETTISWDGERSVRRFIITPSGRPRPMVIPVERPTTVQVSFAALASSTEGRELRITRPGLTRAKSASVALAAVLPSRKRPASPPNVIIYLIDTLRADHLGVYGYDRPTSPNIDAFARDSVVFTNAIAQSAWTRSSVASILTGVTPLQHAALNRADRLPASIPMVQQMLGPAWFRFAAVANPSVDVKFGFGRGFDEFHGDYAGMGEGERRRDESGTAGAITSSFESWLDRRPRGKPFFAYLHTIDPHEPYTAPAPFASRFAGDCRTDVTIPTQLWKRRRLNSGELEQIRIDVEKRYDAEIAYNDSEFGRMIADLKQRGLYDGSLIVVVSDHGEEFLDHGYWGHGHTVYSELLHVPLIVKFPGGEQRGTRVDKVVEHIDLVPTILAAAGVAKPEALQGIDLFTAADLDDDRPVVSYLRLDNHEASSVLEARWHYVRWRHAAVEPAEELFRLTTDPSERWNVAAGSPAWMGYLRSIYGRAFAARRSVSEKTNISGELARKLRALGYLQ